MTQPEAAALLSGIRRRLGGVSTAMRPTSLSPVGFVERSATVYPSKVAVRHGRRAFTYAQFQSAAAGLRGARTAWRPPRRYRRHHGAEHPADARGPLRSARARCRSNPLNVRLDGRTIASCLVHGEAKVLLTDAEFAPVIRDALGQANRTQLVVDIDDSEGPGHGDPASRLGALTYEELLAEGDPAFGWPGASDEWDALALLYTSGTTGDPKGVVYHHRGAYLALGNALAFRLGPESVYLWTLPMFHCSGWTYTWAVTAVGATHVCLRRFDPALVFAAIADHRVTHCGAPMSPQHADPRTGGGAQFDHVVDIATEGRPPSAVIEAMEDMGFRVTHLYGLTESYGPATLCAAQDDWDALSVDARAARMARQGVTMPTLADLCVADPDSAAPVPRDGRTMGELMLRGNTIMKGYLKNATATSDAFRRGWFHTGDLAVRHPDWLHRDQGPQQGHHHLGRREHQLARNRGVPVSAPPGDGSRGCGEARRPLGGDTPCAFETDAEPGSAEVTAQELIAWCRDRIAHYKVRSTWCSGRCPRPRPERSRRTCCASELARTQAPHDDVRRRPAARPARARDRSVRAASVVTSRCCSPRTVHVMAAARRAGARRGRDGHPQRRRRASAVTLDVRDPASGRIRRSQRPACWMSS